MKDDIGHRSVFISDLHLGSKHCKDKELLKFLQEFKGLPFPVIFNS